jgi:hypothetical protein
VLSQIEEYLPLKDEVFCIGIFWSLLPPKSALFSSSAPINNFSLTKICLAKNKTYFHK